MCGPSRPIRRGSSSGRRVEQVLGVALPVYRDREVPGRRSVARCCNKPDDRRLAVDVPGWRPDLVERDRSDRGDRPAARLRSASPPSSGPTGWDRWVRIRWKLRPPGAPRAGRLWGSSRAQSLSSGAEGRTRSASRCSIRSRRRKRLSPASLTAGADSRGADQLVAAGARHPPVRNRHGVPPVRSGRAARRGARGSPESSPAPGSPAHWTTAGQAPDYDLWDLKALFEAAVALAIPGARVQVDTAGWVALRQRRPNGWPGFEPLELDAPPWAAPVFGFELLRSMPRRASHATIRAAADYSAGRAGSRAGASTYGDSAPKWWRRSCGGGGAAAGIGRGVRRVYVPRSRGRTAQRGVSSGVSGGGPNAARR